MIHGVKGDRVTIYEDPVTEKIREGRATLVNFINKDSDGRETWEVQFVDEKELYVRSFYPRDNSRSRRRRSGRSERVSTTKRTERRQLS